MLVVSSLIVLSTLFAFVQLQQTPLPQTQGSGTLQQNIYQFLKSNQATSRFGELLDRIAQQNNDRSVISALSGETTAVGYSNTGFTVFVPTNDVLNQAPTDVDQLKNDIYNLIVKDRLTLERLREMNGLNISRTFGYKPHFMLKTVKNFYSRQYSSSMGNPRNNMQASPTSDTGKFRRQINDPSQYNNPYGPTSYNQQQQQQQFSTQYPNQYASSQYPNQYNQQYPNQYNSQFPNNQFSTQFPNQFSTRFPNEQVPYNQYNNQFGQQSDQSVYEIYNQMYGGTPQQTNNLGISPKLPEDELYLINSAIILDRFDLTNGIVYVINSYPRFYEKSLLMMLQEGDVNGLAQNLNFWITRAAQAFRVGDENLKNALNAFGPNTYFLPSDIAFNKFTDKEKLNNITFLFDVLFRSHRVSNRLLFDHYLDDSSINIYTDTGLPVSTRHRIVNGIEDIEISIGHVKGKIIPEYRNIYCASGIIHLVDTVLGVPTKSAYQEISMIQELSSFRSIIDRSSKYRQLLDQSPPFMFTTRPYYGQQRIQRQPASPRSTTQAISNSSQTTIPRAKRQQFTTSVNQYNTYNQYNSPYGYGDAKYYTILAPNDAALIGIKEDILRNDSAIEEFLSAHIISDSSNRVFYTDHDDSVFQNGQTYQTLNPMFSLMAEVQQDPNLIYNRVTLKFSSNPAIRTTIVNGNSRVSNGVIHIVDKPLSLIASSDITTILDKYSTLNSPGSPAFSQFVDALRITGIFNDLRQPSRKYTLFIPTNEALARYQDIINGNDIDKKRKLIYRHMCLDQNLQSTQIVGQNNPYNPNQQYNQQLTTQSPYQNPNQIPNQNQNQNMNQNQNNYNYNTNPQGQLICRNALGQDLTLTKDSSGLVSNWQGKASSKIINDFPGIYSSAYLLEKPLLNQDLPNYGLNNLNTASSHHKINLSFILCLSVFLFKLNQYFSQ